MTEILLFVLGIMLALAIGAVLWACFLFAKNRVLKRQICDLMCEKGALTMRVGVLEDLLKEKGY